MAGREKVVRPQSAHVVETEVDDEISVYDPSSERVTVFNGTASDIWRLADGAHTVDDIVQLLAASYDVDPAEIESEVAQTIDSLFDAGLLDSR